MAEKPSAGPWRYERGDPFNHGKDGEDNGFIIYLGDGRTVVEQIRYCEDIYPEDGKEYEIGEANARILAAARSMLDALEMVRDADDDCKRDGLPTIPDAARFKIDAAISEARGTNTSGN